MPDVQLTNASRAAVLALVLVCSCQSPPPNGQVVRDLRAYLCQQASDMMNSAMGQETPGIREMNEDDELRRIQKLPVKVVKVSVDRYERNIAIAVATVPSQMFGEVAYTLVYQRTSGGWHLMSVEI